MSERENDIAEPNDLLHEEPAPRPSISPSPRMTRTTG